MQGWPRAPTADEGAARDIALVERAEIVKAGSRWPESFRRKLGESLQMQAGSKGALRSGIGQGVTSVDLDDRRTIQLMQKKRRARALTSSDG